MDMKEDGRKILLKVSLNQEEVYYLKVAAVLIIVGLASQEGQRCAVRIFGRRS